MYDLENRPLSKIGGFLLGLEIGFSDNLDKKRHLAVFFDGGRSVTLLEPTYIITDWFLNSNNWSMIKLQEQSVEERRKQILEMNYVF